MTTERILCVRLSSFGDVVLAMPAVQALRNARPHSHITWIVEDRCAAVLEGGLFVDELIVMPRREWKALRQTEGRWAALSAMRQFSRELGDRHFDIALDFQANLKSGWVTRSSGATRRIGYSDGREGNGFFLNERVAVKAPHLHVVDRALQLLSALEIEPTFAPPQFEQDPALASKVDHLIAASGIEGPFLVIHPGTSLAFQRKRWPLDRYAELSIAMAEKGLQTLISHGPGDEELVAALQSLTRGAAKSLVEITSPRELALVFRRADLVIGGDTGPLHWAAIHGCPTINLIGPYDPRIYHPYGHPERAIYRAIPCSPCRYRACPRSLCMEEIEAEDAIKSVESLMNGDPLPQFPHQPNQTVLP